MFPLDAELSVRSSAVWVLPISMRPTGKRSLLSVLNVVVVFSAQLDLECGFQRTAQEKFALGRDFALIEGHPISHPWLLPCCIEHHRAEAVRNAH